MLRIVLIRPGSTDFDEQGRIKGTLDIPLNDSGRRQVERALIELGSVPLEVLYTAPCQSARDTAGILGDGLHVKVKNLDLLRNLDHGLWHGRRIEEFKQTQPKVYRLWQDSPESVCPPEGETVAAARQRVCQAIQKLLKKHRQGVIGLVVSEPLASIVRSCLAQRELRDLWKSECDFGSWEFIDLSPDGFAVAEENG
jgi:broad specificity phosphatase PhoE